MDDSPNNRNRQRNNLNQVSNSIDNFNSSFLTEPPNAMFMKSY